MSSHDYAKVDILGKPCRAVIFWWYITFGTFAVNPRYAPCVNNLGRQKINQDLAEPDNQC